MSHHQVGSQVLHHGSNFAFHDETRAQDGTVWIPPRSFSPPPHHPRVPSTVRTWTLPLEPAIHEMLPRHRRRITLHPAAAFSPMATSRRSTSLTARGWDRAAYAYREPVVEPDLLRGACLMFIPCIPVTGRGDGGGSRTVTRREGGTLWGML
ncbi:hypothetical protein LZ30DRAFT_710026 [Colletotrichum cereale]|nr:hypothetical protein LZ30DRAFT_710026 [Colletotrichum cereale]